jgi:LysM repeat protein
MRFATCRLGGKPLGRWAIPYARLAMGLVIGCGTLLLLMPNTAYAQRNTSPDIGPEMIGPVMMEGAAPVNNEAADAELIHVIKVGDTLTNVAQRYDVKPADLATYNQILDFNHVVIGQQLRIPPVGVEITAPPEDLVPGADGYHVVRKGESLSAIGRLYNLTLEEMMALNDISDPNTIQMGQMLRLTEEVDPAAIASKADPSVITYEVKRGETLDEIATAHQTTIEQILHDNAELKPDGDLHAGQELRILVPADAEQAFGVVGAPLDGERKIVIDLSEQTLTAYQGDVVVLQSIVSTGKASTPTLPGEFSTFLKYSSQHMSGDDYDLPGVPWVMYYYDEYAIHGAYWHANFGIPTSHGCTNMTIAESKALYSWAPLGTKVIVQE